MLFRNSPPRLFSGLIIACLAPATLAGLTAGSGYQVQYQINGVPAAAIDRISDGQLAVAAFSVTQDVTTLSLNTGPLGPTVYTQPQLPGGSTFSGGFIATDGTHALTGQTGFPANAQGLYPGRLFLTNLGTGATSTLDVPGNWDGTQTNGDFYVTAAAGTSSGLAQNGSSGIYQVQRAGGTLTGLNLILDTNTASGLLSGDSAGNLAFSLGGVSVAMGGNNNDLFRLTTAQIASAVAAGPTTGLAPSAADKLISGATLAGAVAPFFNAHTPAGGSVYTSVSDLLFTPNGDLIVGLSGFISDQDFNFVGTVGEALLLHVTHAGSNYSASVGGIVYSNDLAGAGSMTYRASDNTLWVADGSAVYGLSLVPEPASFLLLLAGLPLVRGGRRNGRVSGGTL